MIERRHTDEEILDIVKRVQNGKVRIGVWQWVITTLPILLVLIGTAVTGGLELGTIKTQVKALENFRDKGFRYTAAQGAAVEARVEKLEKWTESAPPSWFRSEVSRLSDKVLKLESSLTDLIVEVRYMERRRQERLKDAREN